MTGKERLEEIKKHRDEAENSIDEYEFEKINFYNLHVDWLIEQAERVQELENKCEYLSDTNEMLLDLNGVLPDQPELYIKLKKEIKRLEDFIETIQNVHFVELQREKAENRRYREVINNINEKAMLYGVDEQVFEAIKEAIRVLEGRE